MKRFIVHGKFRQVPLGRNDDGLHGTLETVVVGESFDEIVIKYHEEMLLSELLPFVSDRCLTRLKPGGKIIIEGAK